MAPLANSSAALGLELDAHDVENRADLRRVGSASRGDRRAQLIGVAQLDDALLHRSPRPRPPLRRRSRRPRPSRVPRSRRARASASQPSVSVPDAELLDDRLGELGRGCRSCSSPISTPRWRSASSSVASALGENRDLRLLERDRDDLAALGRLKEKSALAGLADGSSDEAVGGIKAVNTAGHVNSGFVQSLDALSGNVVGSAPAMTLILFGFPAVHPVEAIRLAVPDRCRARRHATSTP